MVASFLISLREGLEVALIIGIVLGALHKTKRGEFSSIVWVGGFSAGLISITAGLILYTLGAGLEGIAEQVFEGLTMLLAASVLTWMIFWMQGQARTIKSGLEAGVHLASIRGGKGALFSLAFLAVLREGIELVLFLTAATFSTNAVQTLAGAVIGLTISIFLGWLLFTTTVRLDLHRFFQFTGALLILFAAGLVAHGVHELGEAGWVPLIIEHVWDTNYLLNEDSTIGGLLKALFGYNGNPSLIEVIAYFAYFVAIFFGLLRSRARAIKLEET